MKRRDFITRSATGLVAAGAAAGGLAAPAIAQGRRQLKLVTTWPKNFPGLGTGCERLAKRISEMTDGQITVRVFAGGELVPALSAFDAVSGGTAEMYHGAEYYWQGKSQAYNFFAAAPMGFTADEHYAWINHLGGQELWDELSAPFNIKPLLCGSTGPQTGGWFRNEIKSLEDFKGLKYRIPGLGGEVVRRMGAAVVTLAGGDIFPSLQSGAIDGAEWVGPWNDMAFGFYKVAKHYYYPGFQEPGSVLSLGINTGVWESFTKQQQAIIKAAAEAENAAMLAEFLAHNGDALRVLTQEHGVQLHQFPEDVLKEIGRISGEVIADAGNTDATSKKVYASFKEAYQLVKGWTDVGTYAFLKARDLDYTYFK
jgi:TRAP-type mannitol/chloroaromatic compound transport system substrate-binding protein